MAKVLLVEDDNNLREIYEARLQAEGYTIVSASDGEQALVVAKNEKPDLVISDVMMPKISGFEMLDILRNTDGLKNVKVIMLTALGQSEDKTRADQLGANKYLVKSQVTLEDIVKTAHQLLDDGEVDSAPAATSPAPVESAAPAAAIVADQAATPTPVAPPAAPASEPAAAPVADVTAPAAVPAADPAPAVTPSEPATTTDAATPTPAATTASMHPLDPLADSDPANDPLTTADEQAAMAAKLDAFVNEPAPVASTETQTPPANEQAAPTAVETPATEPVATVPVADTTAATEANDATMADAVDSLTTGSDGTQQKPSDVTAVEVPPTGQPTAPSAPDTPPSEPATPSPAADDTDSDSMTMGHKKIIKPLDDLAPKKDIHQLLAEEVAKSAAPPNPSLVTPEPVAPEPAAPTSDPASTAPATPPASPTDPNDPNSVAL